MLVSELIRRASSAHPAGDDRRRCQSSIVTLLIALTPIAVAVGRAIFSGWVPTADAGYFAVRSRDVLTSHHPWLGAWSWASVPVGATMRNLGPLQLDLLAPFTKVDPYAGTAAGVGVVSAGAVVAVWWSALRVIGPAGAGAAMLATLAVEAAVGPQAFIDPRQQVYLLLPYWALLWLTWAAAMGLGAAIAPLVFTASLISQTHFSYLYQAALLLVVGVALFVVAVRDRWYDVRATRSLLIALAVGLACWAQPVWDQVAGDGNLAAVLANRETADGVGWAEGAQVVAGTVLMPPSFWLPGTLAELTAPVQLVGRHVAWSAVLAWLALLVGSVVLALRRRLRVIAALGGVAIAALFAAVVAGSQIPGTALGVIPQNYYWMWPTGVFVTVAVAAWLPAGSNRVRRIPLSLPGVVAVAAAGAVIATARPVDHFANTASAATAATRVARPAVDQLAVWLRLHDVEGPVLIDYSRAAIDSHIRYAFLAELQRAGIAFLFGPGDANIDRFGRARCTDNVALSRIILDDTGQVPVQDGELVLAHVDAFSEEDEAELASLDRLFGDLVRDGTVLLDIPHLEFLAGQRAPELRRLLSERNRTATGLAGVLDRWTAWDVVDVPDSLRDEFDRWIGLETRSRTDLVTVLLAPPATSDGSDSRRAGRCPS